MFNEKLKITPSKKVNAMVLTTIYCIDTRVMNLSKKERNDVYSKKTKALYLKNVLIFLGSNYHTSCATPPYKLISDE